jgi:hypothetical protein
MSVFKIKFYSDSGHGWAAVKRQTLYELCIADKITTYSYQKGGTVYLEEDCDLPTLTTALSLKGVKIEYIVKSTESRSPIRTYDRFKA